MLNLELRRLSSYLPVLSKLRLRLWESACETRTTHALGSLAIVLAKCLISRTRLTLGLVLGGAARVLHKLGQQDFSTTVTGTHDTAGSLCTVYRSSSCSP